MIISVCGFGSTGSSAVSDYISEFSSVQVVDSIEFDLVYRPDGLFDLYHHILDSQDRTYSASFALERFKKMIDYHIVDYYCGGNKQKKKELKSIFSSFIKDITEVEWAGYQNPFYSRIKSFFQGLFLGHFFMFTERKKCYPISNIVLCKRDETLLSKFKKLINDVLIFLGCDLSKPVVLDQAFSGNNPQAVFPFFDSPKAIVVDRDPRDLYIFANEVLKKKKFFHNTIFMPTNSVEDFVAYYKLIRKNQPYLENDKRILRISFEDLIYKYGETTEIIRRFCNLSNDERTTIQFDPSISIANTQLFKRFAKYKKEIELIEKELPEYLYNFPNLDKEMTIGDMFCGKSPLRGKR